MPDVGQSGKRLVVNDAHGLGGLLVVGVVDERFVHGVGVEVDCSAGHEIAAAGDGLEVEFHLGGVAPDVLREVGEVDEWVAVALDGVDGVVAVDLYLVDGVETVPAGVECRSPGFEWGYVLLSRQLRPSLVQVSLLA